jgi:hypothetical protein
VKISGLEPIIDEADQTDKIVQIFEVVEVAEIAIPLIIVRSS